MPVLFLAALIFFWRSLYPRRGEGTRRGFVVAGFILGLSWYTYMPARITWLVPVLFACSLALTDRERWRRTRMGVLLMVAIMMAVAAPLIVFLGTHPELEVRVDELAAPLRLFLSGDAGPLWARLQETAGLFSHRGDRQWIYNIAGKPLLPPLLAFFFYCGVMLALIETIKERRPGHMLLLLWLPIGVLPALVTGLESSTLRAIGAQPAVFALAALPPVALFRWLIGRIADNAQVVLVVLVILALAALGYQTIDAYFYRWAEHPDTRVAYHTPLREIATYLDAQPDDSPVVLSSLYPGRLHDPYAMQVLLERDDLDLYWHDGRFSLVFPDANYARLVIPALAPLDTHIREWIPSSFLLLERVELHSDDLSPWFDVYILEPQKAWQISSPLGKVELGGLLAFVGYEMNGPAFAAGEDVELLTLWETLVSPPPELPLVLFAHILNETRIVAQDDRLDVPPSTWRPGMRFVQLDRITLPTDLAAGEYRIEIGAYKREENYPRLPVYRDGNPDHDRIQLGTLIVGLTGEE